MGNSDSKSRFRESVYKLNNEVISSKNIDFWDKLWRTPTMAEEIFTLIQPDDVRMLRRQQPANLATMVHQAVSQLTQIVETPLPKYYQQATNSVRILTRILPFILEDSSDGFLEELLWNDKESDELLGNTDSDRVKNKDCMTQESASEPSRSVTLARQLIHAIMGMLFLPEYTVPVRAFTGYGEERRSLLRSGESLEPRVYPSLLWAACIGYPDANVADSSQYDQTRKELLKLLLTCYSGILYQTADTCTKWKDRFLEIATAEHCPFASTLFYSLLNSIVTYDPIGWGIPYANAVLSDDRECVVDAALQVLLVLLDYGQVNSFCAISNSSQSLAPSSQVIQKQENRELESTVQNYPTVLSITPKNKEIRHSRTMSSSSSLASQRPSNSPFNLYRQLLAGLSREDDLKQLMDGISRLLNNYHQSMSTLLPNSIKQIQCHQELLVLLWKLLDENKHFLNYVLRSNVNDLVVPLLFFMYEGRQEPSKVGMIHICTFILLLLSGERDFGVSLNTTFDQRLSLDLPLFSGSHADLLIVCLHKIIVSGYEKLNSVYNCFLTIICNISPYCKKLHMVSSIRLMRLFKLFAQPQYLFDNEANHHLVSFLLEAFDNIIQYQYEGNPQLVYAIIQSKNVFYRLHDLKLPMEHQTSTAEDVQVSSSAAHFIPTEEWLASWKKKLPLNTSLRLLQNLVPQLEKAIENAGGYLDEEAIVYFLRATTMVGLLPVPHPIVIRKYQINQYTHLWFTTFTWGVIFLRNQILPLFDGSSITLFTISVL